MHKVSAERTRLWQKRELLRKSFLHRRWTKKRQTGLSRTVLTVTKDQIDAEKTEQLTPINEYLGRQPSDAKTVATAFAISAVIAESSKDEVPFIIKAIQKAEKGTEKTANTPVKKHQSFLEDIKNIHKEMGADDGISSLSDKNKDKDGQNISY